MAAPVNPRLENLLSSLALGLTDDAAAAVGTATGLSDTANQALLALAEFLDAAPVRRLAEVLGLTHSGAVRLVAHLEAQGLAVRVPGERDRRTVEVRLTPRGRAAAARGRGARAEVVRETLAELEPREAAALERLAGELVEARVRARMARRARGLAGPWWCRTCDFGDCGRPDGRCPAQTAAAGLRAL